MTISSILTSRNDRRDDVQGQPGIASPRTRRLAKKSRFAATRPGIISPANR
jgi:hypothetical protein